MSKPLRSGSMRLRPNSTIMGRLTCAYCVLAVGATILATCLPCQILASRALLAGPDLHGSTADVASALANNNGSRKGPPLAPAHVKTDTAAAVYINPVNATHVCFHNTCTPIVTGLPSLFKPADALKFEVFPGCTPTYYGKPGTKAFIVYCKDQQTGKNDSFWHDIPLDLREEADGSHTLWVVNEIPKGTHAKYQTVTTKLDNPINQDVREVVADRGNNRTVIGEYLRYYVYGPSLVNYGGIPQTWEDSEVPDPLTGHLADNDPLDFLEIGQEPAPVGAVYRAKILGALSLVDQNETDWKIIVINVKDPRAKQYSDIQDVPHKVKEGLWTFFRDYKAAEGKMLNDFYPFNSTMDSAFYPAQEAAKVVEHKHDSWKRLMQGECQTARCKPLWLSQSAQQAIQNTRR